MRDPIYEGVSVEDTQSSWERFIAVTDNDTTSETEDLVFAIEGDIVTSEGNVGLDAVPDPASGRVNTTAAAPTNTTKTATQNNRNIAKLPAEHFT